MEGTYDFTVSPLEGRSTKGGGSRGFKWEGLTAAARLKVVADYVGGLCRKVVFAAVSAVYSPLP